MSGEGAREDFEFEVALSFAGEDRAYVREVRDMLLERGRAVFYDEDRIAEMWGADLPEYLDRVYRERSRFVVAFISQHYVSKAWPRHEKRSALARALEEKGPYFLPVRLDDTVVPGMPDTVGHIDTRRTGLERLVEVIVAKLDGREPLLPPAGWSGKSPQTPGETAQLLRERPAGWEYLLFAGTLAQGVRSLEGKYRDHELRFAVRSDKYVADSDAVAYVNHSMDTAQSIANGLAALFDPTAQERAFGAPGSPGDAERIVHLAERVVTLYEEFMDWSADLRGVAVSSRFHELFELTARLNEKVVEEFRQFIASVVDQADLIPGHFAKPEPREKVRIDMVLKLTIPQEAVDRVTAELRRVR